jgi:hypothetical protein
MFFFMTLRHTDRSLPDVALPLHHHAVLMHGGPPHHQLLPHLAQVAPGVSSPGPAPSPARCLRPPGRPSPAPPSPPRSPRSRCSHRSPECGASPPCHAAGSSPRAELGWISLCTALWISVRRRALGSLWPSLLAPVFTACGAACPTSL